MIDKLLLLLAILSCVQGEVFKPKCNHCGLVCDQQYCAKNTTPVGCIKKIVRRGMEYK